MTPNLALFDLDYTLLTVDSDVEWSRFLFAEGYVDADSERKREQYAADYHNGVLNLDEFLAFQLGTLARFSRSELTKMHERFMHDYIVPKIAPEARELVRRHHEQGDDLLLVSATNEFIITPIAHHFGITEVIGVTLEEDEQGNFTGRYVGTPSYREGKVTRVNDWLKKQQKTWKDYRDSYFYSDSFNDLPLLQSVTRPVAVNPDVRLQAVARERAWPELYFTLEK